MKIQKNKLPIFIISLFCSYAKGNYTVVSEINLMVVCKVKVKKDVYSMIKYILAIRNLEPHRYTKAAFIEMIDTIEKMINDTVVLYQDQ